MKPILPLAAALLLGAFGSTAVRAEVWKCTVDGKIHYADQPCAKQGQALKPPVLQGNVIDTAADRAHAERARAAAAAANAEEPRGPAAPAPAVANVCPSDREIAGLQTKASAVSLSPEAKRFINDEIRRARQCQKGQGSYSAADWAISQQAVDAQSSISGGADARRRAEAMHSAANASEGDRIARQRELEEREAQLRRQRVTTDR